MITFIAPYLYRFTIAVCALLVMLLPQFSSAEGLVKCDGPTCGTCELVALINDIVIFIISIATVIAIILFAYAGFLIFTSAGNMSQVKKGKDVFVNVLIGFMIMLSAWLIVDTVMKTFIASNGNQGETIFGPWNTVDCSAQRAVVDGSITEFDNGWEGLVIDYEEELASTFFYVYYNLQTAGYESCKNRGSEIFPTQAACEAQLAVLTGTFGNDGYTERNCAGSPVAGALPGWANLPQCGIGTESAGQICYSGGDCFDAVTISHSDYQASCSGMPTQFIELSSSNLSKRVSPNFTFRDVVAVKANGAFGNFAYIHPQAVAGLQAMRQHLGKPLTISSGYRSPHYNRTIAAGNDGVASCSDHMKGRGFDFSPIPSGETKASIGAACRAAGADFVKADYANHVHCSWR